MCSCSVSMVAAAADRLVEQRLVQCERASIDRGQTGIGVGRGPHQCHRADAALCQSAVRQCRVHLELRELAGGADVECTRAALEIHVTLDRCKGVAGEGNVAEQAQRPGASADGAGFAGEVQVTDDIGEAVQVKRAAFDGHGVARRGGNLVAGQQSDRAGGDVEVSGHRPVGDGLGQFQRSQRADDRCRAGEGVGSRPAELRVEDDIDAATAADLSRGRDGRTVARKLERMAVRVDIAVDCQGAAGRQDAQCQSIQQNEVVVDGLSDPAGVDDTVGESVPLDAQSLTDQREGAGCGIEGQRRDEKRGVDRRRETDQA